MNDHLLQSLGAVLDRALDQNSQAPAGPWLTAYLEAYQNGLIWPAWDRYGRWLGQITWVREETGAAVPVWRLVDVQAARGAIWRLRLALRNRLASTGTGSFVMGRRVLRQRSATALLHKLRADEAPAPLHPVLAGMAGAAAADAMELARAVWLLAQPARHADVPLAELVRRVRRAQGSGHLLLHGADGLVIWARPCAAEREALCSGLRNSLHAAEWNAGGEPVMLDFVARTPEAAAWVAQTAAALLTPGDTAVFVRVAIGASASPGWPRVARDDVPALQQWLLSALSAELPELAPRP